MRRGQNELRQLSVLRSTLQTIPTSRHPQAPCHSCAAVLNLFGDLDDSLTLDDSGEYDTEFEEDEDDQEFEADVWGSLQDSYEGVSEDGSLANQQPQVESRHPIETVLRRHPIEEPDIRIDDALSFVSNLVCAAAQGAASGRSGSSSSKCSTASAVSGPASPSVGRSPRRVLNRSMNSSRSPVSGPSG
jgi:hypothetical protein